MVYSQHQYEPGNAEDNRLEAMVQRHFKDGLNVDVKNCWNAVNFLQEINKMSADEAKKFIPRLSEIQTYDEYFKSQAPRYAKSLNIKEGDYFEMISMRTDQEKKAEYDTLVNEYDQKLNEIQAKQQEDITDDDVNTLINCAREVWQMLT